jgi:uncharacterized protein YbaR (Trm112 family)
MLTLSAVELLSLWDAGVVQTLPQRALHLLAAADTDRSLDSLAALSIGQRDAKLFALRQTLWGPQMLAVLTCPSCRDRLELTLDTREILADCQSEQPGEMSLSIAGYRLTFRLPTSLDLIAAAGQTDPEAWCTVILQRCVLSAQSA